MKRQVLQRALAYGSLNDLALKDGIVVYGSTYMAEFPFYELINKSQLEDAFYNRSIPGMDLSEALELLPECVIALRPGKVFLHLGEEDYDRPDAVETYTAIVEQLRTALPDTAIYLIGLQEEGAASFNEAISRLSDRKNVSYLHLTAAPLALDFKRQFKELSSFFRSHPITCAEAFAVAEL